MFYFFITLFIGFKAFSSDQEVRDYAPQPSCIKHSTGSGWETMPIEILSNIAHYLPLHSLLNFRSISDYCYMSSQSALRQHLTNRKYIFNLSNTSFLIEKLPLEEKLEKNELSILLKKSIVLKFSLHLSLIHFCMRKGKVPGNLTNIKGLSNRLAFSPFKYGDEELTYLKYAPIRYLHLIDARLNTQDFRNLMRREPGQIKEPFADLKEVTISLPRAKNFTGLVEFLSHYSHQLTTIHLSNVEAFQTFIQFLSKEKKIFTTSSLVMPFRVPLDINSIVFKKRIKNVFITLKQAMPTLSCLRMKVIHSIYPENMRELVEITEKIAKIFLPQTLNFLCDF